MIEAVMPSGFASMGQIRTPDCVSYNSSLAFSAITGMSCELTAKAVESDVVSQILEQQLQRPVNFVDLFIKDAEITDASGKKVRKKTLFSPDFGKSIQDVTNMEEKDGQVWEVTNRLSDTVVNANGESWHLLASPGEKHSDDHRLILIHNRGDGRAREYFVTIRSSRKALEKVVENLCDHSFAGNEDVSTVIISREKNKEEPPITLRDIFDRFTGVLDDKEREEGRSFLQELKKDAYSTEEELEKRNSRVGKLVEKEIKEILTDKPSLEALGLVAQSIPRWAKMVEETTNYTRDEPSLAPTTTLRLIGDIRGTGLPRTPAQEIKLTEPDQQFAKQVIEPIVPILLALVGELAKNDLIVNDNTITNDQLRPQSVVFQKQPAKDAVVYDDLDYFIESEKKASWQRVIAEILMFNCAEATSGQTKEVIYHRRSQQQGFDESGQPAYGSLRSLRYLRGVKSGNPWVMDTLEDADWNLLNLLSIKIKKDEKPAGDSYNESGATIIANFQKVLEYIADFNPEITSGFFDKKKAAIEEEAVSLGRRMLGTTFEGLPFLLAVYDDENTCKEARYILAVLIYREISQLGEDKNLLIQYPKPSSLKERLNKLSKNAAPLEKRFGVLKKTVSRLLMLNMPDDYSFDETFQHAPDHVLLMIFCLARFIEQQKSAERLSNTDKTRQTFFMSGVSKTKKKQKTLPFAGTIYSFSCQVIYQYRPLVIGRSDMAQYE